MQEATTDIRQHDQETILTGIFASRSRVVVLRVFMLDPLRAYYQRQLEHATGLPIRAVQRELERLTSVGLLYRRVEGNRSYCQVDMEFPLFDELRSMILKTGSPEERLRGQLAIDESVQLALLREEDKRVLVVTSGGKRPTLAGLDEFTVETMNVDAFTRALSEAPETLAPYLAQGVDLLGRRDGVLWRRIEAAGYIVQRGKGVP
jgi:DNA-binding transcriptional ArsR family regulator